MMTNSAARPPHPATLSLTFVLAWACGLESRTAPDAGPTSPPEARPTDAGSEPGCGTSRIAEPGGGCTLDARLKVPLRDGVRLETHVLVPPEGAGPWPTLLLRTPYAAGGDATPLRMLRPWLREGVAVVVQSCRGTGPSEGTLEPLRQEFGDGQDTVRWIARQPWSNGRVGTIGASYEGFTALAAAIDTPEVKVVIADGNITDAFTGWPGQRGLPLGAGMLWWLRFVEAGEDLLLRPSYSSDITNRRPLVDLDIATLGREHPVWRRFADQADRRSAFWEEHSLTGKLGRLCTPALFVQASYEWADDPLSAFLEVGTAGCSVAERQAQRFVLSAAVHAGTVYNADFRSVDVASSQVRAYVPAYLKREPNEVASAPAVSYWVTGADAWRTAAGWPPPHRQVELFLDGAALTLEPGSSTRQEVRFDATAVDACQDPAHPAQLTFTSAPLTAPLELVGAPELQLVVATDSADADLSALIYEQTPTGDYPWVAQQRLRLRFRDGYLEPKGMVSGVSSPVRLTMGTSAHRFAAGSRLVVNLSLTECGVPENPGTMGPIMTETRVVPTRLELFTGAGACRLVLPVSP
jgi:predicted acyl esterase